MKFNCLWKKVENTGWCTHTLSDSRGHLNSQFCCKPILILMNRLFTEINVTRTWIYDKSMSHSLRTKVFNMKQLYCKMPVFGAMFCPYQPAYMYRNIRHWQFAYWNGQSWVQFQFSCRTESVGKPNCPYTADLGSFMTNPLEPSMSVNPAWQCCK